MIDQYGQEVPADLVVIHFGFAPGEDTIKGDPLEPKEIDIITAANWYEVMGYEGIILASYEAIKGLSELDPENCGVARGDGQQINRIADALKRYSLEDGFYHA